ncbi:FecR domain-containing protein [Reichenbachiella agarivorans]|uniref:FecR domain-containing protein n=1 Tax=Reichenbachiella agarivorans TaxID=2979464 RepID=A0ABY6CQP9_9BACT|nr:FecR domain-containing protein [Reichenbachiella agarivorans]UXP32840.1 FecR domain-containing protein [Reichenbachiella agarivorans]
MKKRSHILASLIDKYFSKKSSVDEKKLLDNFASSYDQDYSWDSETMGDKEELSERIFQNITREIEQDQKVKPLYHWQYAVSIAASLALLLTFTFLFLGNSDRTVLVETGSQMDSVFMADGSMIYLGANSAFAYDKGFNDRSRPITLLRGSAFFEVAKNPDKPFVITSGDIKTTVLGTSFNIQMDEQHCLVTVRSGKVNVASRSESVDLLPNEEAYFSNQTAILRKRTATETWLTQWYKKDLELKDVRLDQVLRVLDYKFGVKSTKIDQQILDTRVTVFIQDKATLTSVIEQLNYITSNLKIEIYGGRITIK